MRIRTEPGSVRPYPYTRAALPRRVGGGEGEGITTALAVAAFGAICVASVLVALWAVLRRPLDTRVTRALEQVDELLVEITEQISAASRGTGDHDAGLGDAIGSTIELDEVLDLRAMTELGVPGEKPLPRGG